MILKGVDAIRYFARPDPGRAGLLISGADPMRVALRRQEVIAALIGPTGEAEMRLTRIAGADLRKDPAQLSDAVRAVGFFPGPRVVLVEDAVDALSDIIAPVLGDWQPGDAYVVVTAGALTAKSALKTLFDKQAKAVSIALYDDPPSREEIEAELAKAGLDRIDADAMADLTVLARSLDPGDFRQLLEKVALYKVGDATPLASAEVAALAPATIEAEVDDLIHATAEGRAGDIGPLMRRLEGQGALPVTLCIRTLQHFRALHAAACDPQGVVAGLMRARPPVFGDRRDRMARQVQSATVKSLEAAIQMLVETDLVLRSSSRTPAGALMERTLIRLAMMKR